MPIFRASAESVKGLAITPDICVASETQRLEAILYCMAQIALMPTVMPIGRTEITPSSFHKAAPRHFVTVSPDEESAEYGIVLGAADYGSQPENAVAVQAGNDLIVRRIPDDGLMQLVTGPFNGGLCLHELIFYAPYSQL